MTDNLLDIVAPQWHHDAICAEADPDAWFPEPGQSGRKAKEVCRRCPLSGPLGLCLKYALDNNEKFGVWGGYTEDERREFAGRARRGSRWPEAA